MPQTTITGIGTVGIPVKRGGRMPGVPRGE